MPWREIDCDDIRRFVRETAAATWVVNADGYVLNVPEWSALTGQSESEAEGDGWMDALHPDDLERVRAAWSTAVTHCSHYNTDYRVRCADGIYRWFNARGLPVAGPDGEPTKWMGLILAIAGPMRPSRSGGSERILPADKFSDISPAALRAARSLLNWSADRLAEEAGIARSTIHRLESGNGGGAARRGSIDKVLRVLTEQNVQCIGKDDIIVGVIEPEDTSAA
ncbi:PAS domain-containing protein [Sphingomonas sabuli]|uniref:histidine kinase n=1 Tax=Sphingomonas sabuli TaxID=2764186 RepID=A0A7G9L0R9_9SPHN|nr:PAS domain-containing protein [Sphingomonas sabuli]QNM82218.1 PAS domain-containing protein [Sphingomonas sabuli]